MRLSEARAGSLLGGGELCGLEDAAVHLADERHRVGHALVPARVTPCALTSLATSLEIFIACKQLFGVKLDEHILALLDTYQIIVINKYRIS